MSDEEEKQNDPHRFEETHRSQGWSRFLEGAPARGDAEAAQERTDPERPRAPERIGLVRVPDDAPRVLATAATSVRDAVPRHSSPVSARPKKKRDKPFRIFAYGLITLLVILAVVVRVENDAIAEILQSQYAGEGATNLKSGLVGWWTFDGKSTHWNTNTTDDLSGQGNTGTMVNMSTTTSPTPGKIGQALSFNGGDDATANSTSGSATNFTIQDFTVVAWAKTSVGYVNNGSSINVLFARGGVASGNGYGFSIPSSNIPSFYENTSPATWSTAINDNKWHLIVGIRRGSAVEIWVDGVKGPADGSGTDMALNSNSLYFGNDNFATRAFTGSLDDVRIYSRALSATEVKQLYLMGGGVRQKSIAGNGPMPTPVTLDRGAHQVGYFTSITQGADGFPVIAYTDKTSLDLKFAKCNDALCSSAATSTLNSSDVVQWPSIAIGRDGDPVISYYDGPPGTTNLRFAKCNNAACSAPAISTIDSTAWSGSYSSIAIGKDGFPVISYVRNSTSLGFLKCNDAACSSSTIRTLDPSGVGYVTSIAIGADGFPVIAYYNDVSFDLKFVKCNDASCSSAATSTLDAPGDVGYMNSIATGQDGFPIISYIDYTNSYLKFLKCNNAACSSTTIRTLDSGLNSGAATAQYTSIARGVDGFPVISYYDNTNHDLKFIKCGDDSCSKTIILILDSVGDVGNYSSIAIGVDGFPVISYYDATNLALKFLHCNGYCGSIVTIGKSQESLVPGGLVGYWSFNGKQTHWLTNTTDDLSGQGNTGTMVNMSTTTSPTPGRIGQGLKFVSAKTQYVDAGSASSLDDITQVTYSAWIRPTSYGGGDRVLSKNTGRSMFVWDNGSSGKGFIQLYETTCCGSDGAWRSPFNSVPLNEWTHVAVTFDRSSLSNKPSFFINGVATTTTELSTPTISYNSDAAGDLLIGGNGNFFDGVIDEVRVYNKILPASDIWKLYQAGR